MSNERCRSTAAAGGLSGREAILDIDVEGDGSVPMLSLLLFIDRRNRCIREDLRRRLPDPKLRLPWSGLIVSIDARTLSIDGLDVSVDGRADDTYCSNSSGAIARLLESSLLD